MDRFYCSGFSQIQTEVWRDVSNLFFLFLFMLTVSTVNSSLPQSVVWSVVFISWAVLECCVKPWLVLPSLLRCCGGGRGAQPLWEHEPRLDEAPKLLQNCSADKDKSANTSADGLRKTGVHSRNCHHTEKRLWNIFLELYPLHRRFEPRWYFKIFIFSPLWIKTTYFRIILAGNLLKFHCGKTDPKNTWISDFMFCVEIWCLGQERRIV